MSETRRWILVLGSSSGFGAAACRAFSAAGYDILGVHLDRRTTQPAVARVIADVEAVGRVCRFFNANAASDEKRGHIMDDLRALLAAEGGRVEVLLHSLAFGSLHPFFVPDGARGLTPRQLSMTLDVMASSLIWWARDLVEADLMGPGGRIFAMTSGGARAALPGYGAVSAAKAALEAIIRQLAMELAPNGITANAIQAGVTQTPALMKIPNHEEIVRRALLRNPQGRLTQPEDVAACLLALSGPGTHWMTGNTIMVDGGETVSG